MKNMQSEQKKYIIIFLFLYLVVPLTTYADKAYFDLSEDIIKIETNFTGKEVIIFGELFCVFAKTVKRNKFTKVSKTVLEGNSDQKSDNDL